MKKRECKQDILNRDEKENNQSTCEDEQKCDICGEFHNKDGTYGMKVKGQRKYICKECVDTVHGLI